MPTNFELTFTQPLLVQLDLGRIGGADSYAKAITNAYVRTLLTGVPGGNTIPPVLPAPGLGTPPPPFPIPSVPINNFNRRKMVMERILRTYFKAREFLPVRSNITETIRAIRNLVRKGKLLRAELRKNLADIQRLTKELQDLPNLLEDVKTAVVLLVRREQERVELLYRGLSQFEVSLAPDVFQRLFQRELLLINTIQNFRVTLSPNDFRQLVTILNGLETEIRSIPDISTTSEERAVADVRLYIRKQILGILQRVVAIGNSLVAPEDYISFYRDLVEDDINLQPILTVVERYRNLKQFLEPEIEKLERKKRDLLLKIRLAVTEKLNEQKEYLKEKVKANAIKRDSKGKRVQFLKAAKTIQDTKKKYLKKIKAARSVLQDTQSIIESATSTIAKVNAFPDTIKTVYEQELQIYFQQSNDLKNIPYFNTVGINPAQGVQDVGVEIQGLAGEINAYMERSAVNDAIITKIFTSNIALKLPTVDHFIEFFETKSERLLQPFIDLTTIYRDLDNINRRIKRIKRTLSGDKPKTQEPPFIGPVNQNVSVLDMAIYYISVVNKYVQYIQAEINKLAALIRSKIAEVRDKLIADVRDQIILLIPVKSDIVDKKNKVAIIKNKRDKIRDRKNQLKKRIRQIRFAVRAVRSFTTVARNVSQRKIRYTENGTAINTLIDSLYEIKILDAGNSSVIASLRREKEKKKTDISDYYYGLELLVDLLLSIKRALKEKDVLKELAIYIETQVNTRFINDYRVLYQQLEGLTKLTDDPRELIRYVTSVQFNFKILEEAHVRTLLFNLEGAFLADVRAKYNLVAENSLIRRGNRTETVYRYSQDNSGAPNTYLETRTIYLIKPFEESIFAKAITGIFTLLQKVVTFFKREIFDKALKPIIDKIREKIDKIRQNINEELKVWLQRQANIDAKLMTLAFNLATRAFWTGFSWVSPNAVRYRCLSIGPFAPITAKPDEGSSGLIRQIAKRMQLQLVAMAGLVSPPPPTGIPPFPFVGYR